MAAPSILWNQTAARYQFRDSGRFVPRKGVREALEQSLTNLERRTDQIQADYRAGRISLEVFEEEMRDAIKFSQMAAQELAVGGRKQMTPADYGRVGRQVRTQYAYLNRWTADLAGGAPADGRMEGRAKLYLRAARATYLAADGETMRASGKTLVRSVLHAGESCAECIAEAAKGWVPIGTLVLPGRRTCLGNCRCVLSYA